MDATLLTSEAFWSDPSPLAAGGIPCPPELAGHVLFETSGSTGKPKQVALSKTALLDSAAAVNRHLGVTADSCWGLVLPLNHVGGFGVAARAYEAGCRFQQFGRRWNAEVFAEWLEPGKITHTSLVPTQVHDLVKSNLSAPPSLAAIIVGGGRLDSLTGQKARDLGWPVLASYGMTETGSQIATQSPAQARDPYQPASIPLLPIWKARTTPDGLLEVCGPALFSGYLADGKFTPRATPWHLTSDRVELSENSLTPLGRADSLVKVLGELVDPDAIERELVSISGGVLESGTFAVVAVPDERAGNVLMPVFESHVDEALVESTLSGYNRSVPGFKRLKPAVMTHALPRSGLGKILKSELVSLYFNKTAQDRLPPV